MFQATTIIHVTQSVGVSKLLQAISRLLLYKQSGALTISRTAPQRVGHAKDNVHAKEGTFVLLGTMPFLSHTLPGIIIRIHEMK